MSEKLKYDFFFIRGDQFADNVVHMENLDEMPKHTATVLVDMYTDLWKFEKDFYGDLIPPRMYTRVGELVCVVNKPNFFFEFIYRYTDDGMKEMIGYMMFERWIERTPDNKETVHHYDIKQLYISPDYRRKGIATTAVQKFIETIRRWSATATVMTSIDVHKKNQIAMSFYRKIGYRDYSETLAEKFPAE